MIAFDLGYAPHERMSAVLEETGHVYRLLNALYGSIDRRIEIATNAGEKPKTKN